MWFGVAYLKMHCHCPRDINQLNYTSVDFVSSESRKQTENKMNSVKMTQISGKFVMI